MKYACEFSSKNVFKRSLRPKRRFKARISTLLSHKKNSLTANHLVPSLYRLLVQDILKENTLRINFWINQVLCLMNIVLEECRGCLLRILRNYTRKMYTYNTLRHPMSPTLLTTRPLEAHKIKSFHLRVPSQGASLAVVETVKPMVSHRCIQDCSLKVEVARSLDSSLGNLTDLQPLTLEQTSFNSTQLE